jgi:LuxR family maltose regulon positive regulatory protein
MATGQFEDVERHLRNAERWLETPFDEQRELQMVVADDEGLRDLPAGVAVHRAGLALATGDPVATVAHAQRALSLLDQDHHLGQAAAAALIGLATWSGGDLETARGAYVTSLASMRRAGHLADVLGLSIALADIQITQGSLRDALHTYEQALKLNPEHGRPVLRGTADMYVGMSALHRERNDLPTARQLLVRSQEMGAHTGLPQNPYRWRVAMAQLNEGEGDLDAALDLLEEAERVYVGDFSPNVRPVAATIARMWVRQGRTAAALAWARNEGLGVEDDLSYLREYEHVTLARALLGQHQVDGSVARATLLLDRLLDAADDGHRTGSVIEILVLGSLAHKLRSDVPAALVALARALAVAEPEGYSRIFLDEGAPMTALLRVAAEQGIATAYVERLLSAARTRAEVRPSAQGLIDPLSERELDVLRLLGSELAGPEIAGELVVSLHTVRTHSKNIYAKLGVNSRRAAVRRGEELGLMSYHRSR